MTTNRVMQAPSPIDNYKGVLTDKFADFSGRARRAEYWWFVVVNFVVFTVLSILGLILASISDVLGVIAYLAIGVFAIAIIVPSLALAVRRLHDTNKSGWWLLISFIPFGAIVLLVFYFLDGSPEPNQYGPSPKYVA